MPPKSRCPHRKRIGRPPKTHYKQKGPARNSSVEDIAVSDQIHASNPVTAATSGPKVCINQNTSGGHSALSPPTVTPILPEGISMKIEDVANTGEQSSSNLSDVCNTAANVKPNSKKVPNIAARPLVQGVENPFNIVASVNACSVPVSPNIIEIDWREPGLPRRHPNSACHERWVAVNLNMAPLLPDRWFSIVDSQLNGLHVVKLGESQATMVQRSLFINNEMEVTVYVHGKQLPRSHCFWEAVKGLISLRDGIEVEVRDKLVTIVRQFDKWQVCCGADMDKFKTYWKTCKNAEIDRNIFMESSFDETLRVNSCSMLVPERRKRCDDCQKQLNVFDRKARRSSGTLNKFTAIIHFTEEQLRDKVREQALLLEACRKQVKRLREKIVEDIVNQKH